MSELVLIFKSLLRASVYTISYSAVIIAMGTFMGLILAVIHFAGGRGVRSVITLFIYLVRGIPMLIHLFIFYYVLPLLGVSLPPVFIALFGLSIASSAYICEIYRGAIVSIPQGQTAAFKAIGMTYWLGLRKVILPQAMRYAMPPLISWWVIMVKLTSLVSVLSLRELTLAGREMATYTSKPFLVLLIVAFIYFCICFPLSRFGEVLEKKYAYVH